MSWEIVIKVIGPEIKGEIIFAKVYIFCHINHLTMQWSQNKYFFFFNFEGTSMIIQPATVPQKRPRNNCFPMHFEQIFIPVLYLNALCNTWLCERSRHGRCFMEKVVLKNFAIFTGKHLCWSLFLVTLQAWRTATLLKRESNKPILKNIWERLILLVFLIMEIFIVLQC